MKRRALLTALVSGAAGLAGCGALGGGGRTPFRVPEATEDPTTTANRTGTTTGTTATPTTTVPGEDPGVSPVVDPAVPGAGTRAVETGYAGGRRLVIAHVGGAPPEGTALTAAFVAPPTGDGPGEVWMALTNVGGEARTFRFGSTPPFSGYEGRAYRPGSSGRVGLLLVPTDDRTYANGEEVVPDALGEGGCWRARSVYDAPDVPTSAGLSPGASIVGRYTLLNTPEGGCLPEEGAFLFDGPRGPTLSVSSFVPPENRPVRSRFDREVPPVPGFAGTAWFHEGGRDGVVLEPGTERLELPEDSVDLTLRNRSTAALSVNGAQWELYKLHDGTWRYVAPWADSRDDRVLPPGASLGLGVAVDNTGSTYADNVARRVGGGTYAVRFGTAPPAVGSGADPLLFRSAPVPASRLDPSARVAHAALLSVAGPPVEVRPSTADVREVVREDGTVTVTLDLGVGRDAELVVERTDGAAGRELIAEQVTATGVLRNAVPFFESGVDRVRVRAQASAVREPFDRFAPDPGTGDLTVRFRERTYRIRRARSPSDS